MIFCGIVTGFLSLLTQICFVDPFDDEGAVPRHDIMKGDASRFKFCNPGLHNDDIIICRVAVIFRLEALRRRNNIPSLPRHGKGILSAACIRCARLQRMRDNCRNRRCPSGPYPHSGRVWVSRQIRRLCPSRFSQLISQGPHEIQACSIEGSRSERTCLDRFEGLFFFFGKPCLDGKIVRGMV